MIPSSIAFNFREDMDAASLVFDQLQDFVPFTLVGKFAAYEVGITTADIHGTGWLYVCLSFLLFLFRKGAAPIIGNPIMTLCSHERLLREKKLACWIASKSF